MSRPAIFLDRDGTLIEDADYLRSPEQIRLLPGVTDGLRRLQEAGYALIVVSNQSGVARGMFSEGEVEAVHWTLMGLLSESEVRLDGIYYCPHHPDASDGTYGVVCRCRKPEPGMLEQAMREHDLEGEGSWTIGDSVRDLQAGKAVGARTILVRTGKPVPDPPPVEADYVEDGLSEAVERILSSP